MMDFSLNQLIKWLILTLLFPLVFLNGWLVFQFLDYFKPLVTILVLATLLAFILNYPVSILQKRGVNRNYAVALVFILAVLVVIALGITLLPIALEQFNEIAKLLPQWIDSSQAELRSFNHWAFGQNLKVNLGQVLTRIIDKLPDELEYISDKLFSVVIDTIDSVSEALVTVVLAFYLLLDGARVWKGILKKIPGNFTQQLSTSLQNNFQNYLIGQVTLAFLMGISQTIMFLAFQVQFGLLFGLGVGFLSLIPFGDVAALILITLIIASHHFWLAVKVFVASVIIDQIIDQAIAPRLLGSFTGLRPIWVLISLLVGSYIGNILGLLIAVPIAGFIKEALDGWDSLPSDSENAVETKKVPEILTPESTSS